MNDNLRNDAHWKLGPVFCGDHHRVISVNHPSQGVQISNHVYSRKSRTITDLKEAIREEMRAIPRSVCKDVMDNFLRRVKKCTELNGSYLEYTL